jgi:hypothetical protein
VVAIDGDRDEKREILDDVAAARKSKLRRVFCYMFASLTGPQYIYMYFPPLIRPGHPVCLP